MKNTFLFFAFTLLFFSCQSEGELTKDEVGNFSISEESVVKSTGIFAPTADITVTGSASIYEEKNSHKVVLEGFSVSGGPDLKVYLSTSSSPSTFINLGNLGNGARQAFTIPENTDLTVYNHVLIHCQQYNHLFAIAALNNN